MRYVMARHDESQREMAYRIFITDSIYYKSQNKYISVRYLDAINKKDVDNRSGDEIALEVISKAGLVVK